jgi:short-subunit dehydrogenase
MAESLRGRVVVITGASAGIGREAARAFAREGCRVVAAARRAERLEALRAEIQASGGECVAVTMDVADEAEVERLLQTALECFGHVDIWINNAGSGLLGSVEQTTTEEMRRLMDVNFMGAFYGSRAALRVMRGQGSGHIMNVASGVARFPLPLSAAYSATKCAMYGFSEALALELEGSGIHVSTLLVGLTATEFGEAQVKKLEDRPVQMGRFASAASVAARIVHCARRPQRIVYFLPAPPLVLAVFDLLPFLWPRIARGYVQRRTGGSGVKR